MSESQLRRKRETFWETAPAYEGRQEIWDALRAAAHAFEAQDYAMVQALLDASNIRLGSAGSLTEAWDELGNRYRIPPYCLAAPSNLKSDPSCSSSASSSGEAEQGGAGEMKEEKSLRKLPSLAAGSISDDSGKNFTIKLRFHYFDIKTGEDDLRESRAQPDLPTKDTKFEVSSSENVSVAKKRVRDQIVPSFDWRSQSWLFGGRMLLDKQRFDSTRLQQGFVVQVIIRDREATKRLQQLVTSKKERKKKDKKKQKEKEKREKRAASEEKREGTGNGSTEQHPTTSAPATTNDCDTASNLDTPRHPQEVESL